MGCYEGRQLEIQAIIELYLMVIKSYKMYISFFGALIYVTLYFKLYIPECLKYRYHFFHHTSLTKAGPPVL